MMHPESTFETATLPFLDSLYRTALRMVHDQATAEQCIERTYIEARNSFHHLSEVTDLRCWIFSILFRVLHNRRKAWLHIKGWLTGSQGHYDLVEPDDPGRESDQNEMLRALDRIPGIFREVVLLADVEGFRKTEIQKILELSSELVASRLSEGRTRLRAALLCGGPVDPPLMEDPAVA